MSSKKKLIKSSWIYKKNGLKLKKQTEKERLEFIKRVEEESLALQKQAKIRQQKLEEILLRSQQEQRNLLELTNRGQISENENVFSQYTIWSAIDDFTHSPDEDRTFTSNFRRFEDLYAADCMNWADSKKVNILLRKLGTTEHTKFDNYILPRKTSELTFTVTVNFLTELYSPKTSLFHKRWNCMNLTRKDSED